jgi:hypothetical protein
VAAELTLRRGRVAAGARGERAVLAGHVAQGEPPVASVRPTTIPLDALPKSDSQTSAPGHAGAFTVHDAAVDVQPERDGELERLRRAGDELDAPGRIAQGVDALLPGRKRGEERRTGGVGRARGHEREGLDVAARDAQRYIRRRRAVARPGHVTRSSVGVDVMGNALVGRAMRSVDSAVRGGSASSSEASGAGAAKPRRVKQSIRVREARGDDSRDRPTATRPRRAIAAAAAIHFVLIEMPPPTTKAAALFPSTAPGASSASHASRRP